MEEIKTCSSCGVTKARTAFPPRKHGRVCKECKNANQRMRRLADGNNDTKQYEKTKKGYLMRTYRNMLSRVTGIQYKKAHLYEGKEILDKEVFYEWSLSDESFNYLFEEWESLGYDRKASPSIDRIDTSRGYVMGNIRWITHSENSALGNKSKRRKI